MRLSGLLLTVKNFTSNFKQSLIFVFLLLLLASIKAQTNSQIENANQEFLRQQEREELLRSKQEKIPDVRELQFLKVAPVLNKIPEKEIPSFYIEKILLVGDEAKKFQWSLAAANRTENGFIDLAINRCLGAKGINLVMRRIQNAIIKRGYVTTRIVAKPQKLIKGILELTLIPGRIHNIKFASEIDADHIIYRNAVPAKPGDILNLRDIEQALENFKRVPTVEADIQIKPTEVVNAKPGESDLIIKWKRRFPLRLNFSVDDSGTKATGKYLGGVTVSYDNFFALSDLFYINYNHELGGKDPGSRGTRGYVIHYSLPFNYWLLGFTTSSNEYYQNIAEKFQTNIFEGESQNNEIKLSRLIYRDAVRKSTLSLSGWTRSSKNFQNETEIPIHRRRMSGWEFGVNHREFIGASILDTTLSYKQGTGAMDALPAPEEINSTGTSRPQIILANIQLSIPFVLHKWQLRYAGICKAQWNITPLIQQDRFSIGGRNTVRGFNGENVLTADRGWLIRNDLGVALGRTGQEFYLGADYGVVGGSNSEQLVGRSLTGAVLGLRGGYKWLTYDLFVGKPLKKIDGFRASSYIFGFSVNLSF